MPKGYCDNTDCETPDKEQDLDEVTMADEFEGGTADWCKDCQDRDEDMLD